MPCGRRRAAWRTAATTPDGWLNWLDLTATQYALRPKPEWGFNPSKVAEGLGGVCAGHGRSPKPGVQGCSPRTTGPQTQK